MADDHRHVASGRSAEVLTDGSGQVLKVFSDGATPAMVERELAAQALAHGSGLPVAAPLGLAEHGGRPALRMARIDGRPMLAAFGVDVFALARAFVTLGTLHARMHDLGAPALQSQREFLGRHIRSARLPEAVERRCTERLLALPEGDRLCHGDLHPGNVLWTGEGPFIIDWGTACRGNPAADVARTLLLLEIAPLPRGMGLLRAFRVVAQRLYLHGYRRVAPMPAPELRVWWPLVAAARLGGRNERERRLLLPRIARACG